MTRIKTKKITRAASITGLLAGLICTVILPLSFGGQAVKKLYYQITIGDQSFGCYETAETAAQDLNAVRKKLNEQQDTPVMTTLSCSVDPVEKVMKTSTEDVSMDELYQAIEGNLADKMQAAYTIKVNDFTVTVGSEAEVLQTLEAIKNVYDANNCFEIQLQSNEEDSYLVPVFALREGVDAQGMHAMGFEQEVKLAKAYVAAEEISDVATAIAALTKENETPTIYTVAEGDCLSVIAEKYGMQTEALMQLNQLTESEYINIGDELVVTVPQPEISVWYQVQAAYEEEYQAETQYRDNASWYVGTEEVIQQGIAGVRQVVADITYRNGQETERNILQETILAEAQPQIIERGTATPPTYIKPIVGGSFSSPFGSRWGRMHKGVDWSCSIGTSVRASCAGRVVQAGWMNGFGNCITISHSDGKQTRYAHLSKILVSTGQRVEQGEKIALSGNTGNSTGPHIHFEILIDGVQVNPLKYLD